MPVLFWQIVRGQIKKLEELYLINIEVTNQKSELTVAVKRSAVSMANIAELATEGPGKVFDNRL